VAVLFSALLLVFLLIASAGAQTTGHSLPSGMHLAQNVPSGSGSMETLPGGFRRFRDSSGNSGILQRTPDSGFPSTQFIAPVPPSLPPPGGLGPDPTAPSALAPPSTFQQNVPRVPGTQIPLIPFLPGPISPGPNR
jgi:hypothetical protein